MSLGGYLLIYLFISSCSSSSVLHHHWNTNERGVSSRWTKKGEDELTWITRPYRERGYDSPFWKDCVGEYYSEVFYDHKFTLVVSYVKCDERRAARVEETTLREIVMGRWSGRERNTYDNAIITNLHTTSNLGCFNHTPLSNMYKVGYTDWVERECAVCQFFSFISPIQICHRYTREVW